MFEAVGVGDLGSDSHRAAVSGNSLTGMVHIALSYDFIPWVLSKHWHIELALVLLKHWSPPFDPKCEHLGVGSIFVRLPGLPLHFWSEDIFKWTGNALGRDMDFDKSYMLMGNMSMACILVFLDTIEGVEESIKLH